MQQKVALELASTLTKADIATAFRDGLVLINAGYPELLLPQARRLAERNRADPRLAQLVGLAARATGNSALAYSAFSRAARLAPQDALIAHSHARTALEAGKPAVELFRRAASLAPSDGAVLLGLSAAMVADGRASDGLEMLAAVLSSNPLWLDGHGAFAQIARQLGVDDPVASARRALVQHPGNPALFRFIISTLMAAGHLNDSRSVIASARAALGDHTAWLHHLAALVASESGDLTEADRIYALAPPHEDGTQIANQARHELRAGRPEEALFLIEPELERTDAHLLWPYAALAWRVLNDPRAQWLEGDPSLVGVYDLADKIDDLQGLAEHLRGLHFAKEQPLGQSVRGGTQTDGNLLLRDEAPIQQLRAILLDAVAKHVANLSDPRDGHPTLLARRNPLHVAGAWSVRLQGAGFHTDHVHTHGWFSSALYVSLPDEMTGNEPAKDADPHAGWLALGGCRDVLPDLAPSRIIEPKPGRLVLFPSTMWHGTRPFTTGERLTVAFDIAVPRKA